MLRRLDAKTTALFICDIQEAFRKAIPQFPGLIKNVNKMLLAAQEFEIPTFVTEQYPEGLGKTVKDLNICPGCLKFEKTNFSMLSPAIFDKMTDIYEKKPCDVLLCGLEAHVCVEHTAIDLLESDINVYVLADAVCSRTNAERDGALERMRQAGCIISSCENALFYLLQDKKNPKFQAIKKLTEMPSADMFSTPSPRKEG